MSSPPAQNSLAKENLTHIIEKEISDNLTLGNRHWLNTFHRMWRGRSTFSHCLGGSALISPWRLYFNPYCGRRVAELGSFHLSCWTCSFFHLENKSELSQNKREILYHSCKCFHLKKKAFGVESIARGVACSQVSCILGASLDFLKLDGPSKSELFNSWGSGKKKKKSVWKRNKISSKQKSLNSPAVKNKGEEFTNTCQLQCIGELEFTSTPSQARMVACDFNCECGRLSTVTSKIFLGSELSRILLSKR